MCVNKRAWGASSPLQDWRRESRRRRQGFDESRELKWPGYLHKTRRFLSRRNKNYRGEQESSRNKCGTGWVLAARHGARHRPAQGTHVVAAIERRRLFQRRRLLFVMMMGRDGAVTTRAAVHTVRQPRSAGQRRIQERHRQQGEPCCGHSNALLSFRTHEDRKSPQ